MRDGNPPHSHSPEPCVQKLPIRRSKAPRRHRMAVTAVSGIAAGCTVLCPAPTALARPMTAAPAPTALTAPPPLPAKDAANGGENVRTVTDGDTLWSMAEEIYGSGAKWPDLYRASRDGIEKAARAHGFPSDDDGHRIFAGTAIRTPASPRAGAATPDRADPHVARFQRQVAQSGYVSQSGSEAVFDLNRRYCEGTLFSGMWPNPQSPYIVTNLPEVPGQTANTNPPVTWRLREDEAVVLIGTTPPPEAYFSFDLTMVRGSLHTGPVLWPAVGDPVNRGTVKTAGPTPFGQPFALVMTGHERTRAEVHEMLAASGLGGAINDATVPPAMFRLGLGEDADQFLLGIRTAAPEPGFEKALDAYRDAPPLQILRVRPKGTSADQTKPVYAPAPLPVPRLRTAGTGATELDLNPSLQKLRQRIIAAHPGFEARDVAMERGFEQSYPGLQSNKVIDPPTPGIGALSNDADDPLSPSFSLPDGSFVVAYGTNHVATRQASYSSISLYADEEAAVSVAAKNHRDLRGTARDYLPDSPDADKLYAWTFSRAGDTGPTGPHVTELPSAGADFCAQYGADRPVDMSRMQAVARAYMQPETLTHPALSSLLLDRLLVFTPKSKSK
ncbi:LysM peptidoglycan-binding domain-containing protein [Streptomyces sp. NPDC051740]|uniref:LysM peptidoglycan-binding domain-containing protein n=1 Tax=Streptomyces sp. NPDC051740 TaxID=3365673 RepID=UPI00379682A8